MLILIVIIGNAALKEWGQLMFDWNGKLSGLWLYVMLFNLAEHSFARFFAA